MQSEQPAERAAEAEPRLVSVGCQTEPNLIDKLIENQVKKQLDDSDLYQEYLRSAQCSQFWPLDKNPVRSLVPAMVKIDLPEQHLKNESLMYDLVQAVTNNSKLVNLLAKYIHHIVPNVIISKRIDLIPLITCTIRVCRDANEQERLISLLFNLIKRPNEEQRRMILSGIIVVLQVSPNQNSALLLPNLWDHVGDKYPERRLLLAESCASLAHYVRPALRTNLILSILIQLLKDKNAAVRSAACKSFACLLTLIMDRNDEVFDACLSATEDIIHDVLQQTPVNFCEHRYELEQMRFCALETVYPLLCMWSVKLNRFKAELCDFYLAKANRYFNQILGQAADGGSGGLSGLMGYASASSGSQTNQAIPPGLTAATMATREASKAAAVAAIARRRSNFFESRSKSQSSSGCSSMASDGSPIVTQAANSSSFFGYRRQTVQIAREPLGSANATANASMITVQRAIGSYLRMMNYLIPFVFSDAVHSCAWLSKSSLNLPSRQSSSNKLVSENSSSLADANNNNNSHNNNMSETKPESEQNETRANSSLGSGLYSQQTSGSSISSHEEVLGDAKSKGHARNHSQDYDSPLIQIFERPLKFANKLLEPTLIIDESAIVAFHDQLTQEHMLESLDWILNVFLPKFLTITSHFSNKKFYPTILGGASDVIEEFLISSIASIRQLCLLFGKHLTRTKLRPLIKNFILNGTSAQNCSVSSNSGYGSSNATNAIPTSNSTPVSSAQQSSGSAQAAGTANSNNNNMKPSSSSCFFIYIASLTAFEPIEQAEFEEIVLSIRQNLSIPNLTRNDVEILAISLKIIATNQEQIYSPSTRQKLLTYILDALLNYSIQTIRTSHESSYSASDAVQPLQKVTAASSLGSKVMLVASGGTSLLSKSFTGSSSSSRSKIEQQTQTKEFMLIIFRHILTCLVDPQLRPTDWAHILVTKFLPLLISLANDSADVYVCTYARLMCAQLVETFDTYLISPKLTKQSAESILPALSSLKGLTEQIRASNLRRQIECLIHDLNEKFFKDDTPQSGAFGKTDLEDSDVNATISQQAPILSHQTTPPAPETTQNHTAQASASSAHQTTNLVAKCF